MLYTIIDGFPYFHPLLLLTAFLLGAQVPNFFRFVGFLTRLLRFWR